MNKISPDIWSRLADARIPGESLWARRAAPETTERIMAAIDSEARRHLLIPLASNEISIQDTQSRGVSVATRDLSMPEHSASRYLDIICHDASGYDAFDLIGGEMAERLAAGREPAPDIVTHVLSKWRRFWGQLPKQILSREEQIGLFAEIWFLDKWLFPRSNLPDWVERWRGPFGARHDFEWAECSVEVKGTTSSRGPLHRINGLDQLDVPEQGNLLFFSMQLHEEAGAIQMLPSIISECRAQLEQDIDALNHFENALLRAGYSPAHEEEYSKLHLRIVSEGLFAVRDDFPRIISEQFSNGVLPGVERVEYEINLSGFSHLCIAHQSSEAGIYL